MPELVTQEYVFGGWQTVLLYSEEEMAAALGVSRPELRRLLEAGIGLRCHAHPSSNPERRYQFNQDAWEHNLRLFKGR